MSTLVFLFLNRITNTWGFIWQAFGVIRSYRPLLLLPVISAVFCFLTSIITLGGGALFFDIPIRGADLSPATPKISTAGVQQLSNAAINQMLGYDVDRPVHAMSDADRRTTEHEGLLLFAFYIVNYAVITYFNVALASIVLSRLGGGNASLNDGLQVAWSHKTSILQWAILASTVGILIKMVSRSGRLGRWIASMLGYAWRLGSYFVIPLLATENMGAAEALESSAALLKRKWGEVVVATFSFPLLFGLLGVCGTAMIFLLAGFLGQGVGFFYLLAVTYWVGLAILVFCAEQIFIAALYRFATRDQASEGFSRPDLRAAWEGLEPLPIGQAL